MNPLASNEAKGKATEIVSKEIGMSKKITSVLRK